ERSRNRTLRTRKEYPTTERNRGTMPRKKRKAPTARSAPGPYFILSHGIYSRAAATVALDLTESTLAREVKEGRLRCYHIAGRDFFLGEELRAWIMGGKVKGKVSSKVERIYRDE